MTQEISLQALDFCSLIRPGDRVVWGQGGAEPQALTQNLMAQREAIGGFRAFVGMSLGDSLAMAHAGQVSFQSYCGAGQNRTLAREHKLGILPCHYTQLANAIGPVDVLLLQVAEGPQGLSFSIAAEYLVPLLRSARVVIAQVNEQAPWTHGELVEPGDIDLLVRHAEAPLEVLRAGIGDTERAIAAHIGEWVEDGSTLQLGIGSLPEAVLDGLRGHRDLGIHSGAIGDKVAQLMESGVITNSRKTVDPGVTVAGVLLGGQGIYRFAHQNPEVQLRATAYTHGLDVLSRIDRLVTINAAIEVDLTGQINAEIAAGAYVGAVGGAMDFMRGAHASRGGLPIIALPSSAMRGAQSRVVAQLSGPVSTPRADAGLIVTEFGVADLRGCDLTERARRMVAIAHPDFREALARSAGL
ncbi:MULTISPECIES: acetyl-CoA hydrolase/transferase family protein [Pseudomonas]|uniref:acetyl-CoA hydrolase/transferase family protein n=1 Tax=Pseudomonas TaxID=286 RepID=UPI001E51DDCC|nr:MULTISPECIES: acetyl-CoA hydrolase/transferase C-terminal domain-containing protein [Pseudomonas]MCK1156650.1 acetyl-CoA hydrolase [Pseudomonas aeruginosa]MDM3893854.1 acetyl-CoA hydrolase/transferase C-terminal domain-containing protein [Pseudomonas juntendi]